MSRALATSIVAPAPSDAAPARPPRRAGRSRPTRNPAAIPPRLDPEMSVALIEMMREQRVGEAGGIAATMQARGADPTVCAFLADDLREAAHSLADVEAWLQTSLEVLDRPSPATLFEQAVDVGVLENLEHLFQTVDNLRRRLMQSSVGLR